MNHIHRFAVPLLQRRRLLEILEQVQQAWHEGDDEDGGEDEEDEREDDLDRGFHGLGFDVLTAAFADVVGLVLEGLAHARAEALGLDDGGHEERDVLEAAAVGHAAHGGAAHDAHADVVLHAAALVDEGALHARGDLRQRGIEGEARLDADAEQVEHLRQICFWRRWMVVLRKTTGIRPPRMPSRKPSMVFCTGA